MGKKKKKQARNVNIVGVEANTILATLPYKYEKSRKVSIPNCIIHCSDCSYTW